MKKDYIKNLLKISIIIRSKYIEAYIYRGNVPRTSKLLKAIKDLMKL